MNYDHVMQQTFNKICNAAWRRLKYPVNVGLVPSLGGLAGSKMSNEHSVMQPEGLGLKPSESSHQCNS